MIKPMMIIAIPAVLVGCGLAAAFEGADRLSRELIDRG